MDRSKMAVVRRHCIRVLGFVLLGITNTLVAVAPIEILQTHLASFSAWSGTFEQTVVDDSGQLLQAVSGLLDVKKPMQFFWQTEDPFPQLVVSNGDTLWVYDQDLEQVVIRAMNAETAPLPVAILSGEVARLNDIFEVQDYQKGVSQEGAKEVQTFILRPKGDYASTQGSVDFESLIIQFKAGQLTQLQLHDALGQITTLTMASQVENPQLAPARFEFKPPNGVDVIDERY